MPLALAPAVRFVAVCDLDDLPVGLGRSFRIGEPAGIAEHRPGHRYGKQRQGHHPRQQEEQMVEPQPPAVVKPTPQELKALGDSLSNAFTALGERNLDGADAELKKAEGLAKLPEHQAKVERLKALSHYVREFWSAVGEACQGFQGGEEIQVKNTVVAVIERTPDSITLRVAGQSRRYAIRELPSGLAMAIADRWFDQGAASTRVIRGALYAVDRQGEKKDEARRLWQEAELGGVQVGDLMKVLDDTYDKLSGETSERGPVPGASKIVAVKEKALAPFAAALKDATSNAKEQQLAKKLLDAGASLQDPAEHYVVVRESLDLAARSGDAPAVLAGIAELERRHRTDTLREKSDWLSLAAKDVADGAPAKEVLRSSLEAAEAAVKAQRLDLADSLTKAAAVAGRKARDPALAQRARVAGEAVQKLLAAKNAPVAASGQ